MIQWVYIPHWHLGSKSRVNIFEHQSYAKRMSTKHFVNSLFKNWKKKINRHYLMCSHAFLVVWSTLSATLVSIVCGHLLVGGGLDFQIQTKVLSRPESTRPRSCRFWFGSTQTAPVQNSLCLWIRQGPVIYPQESSILSSSRRNCFYPQ